LVTTKLDFEVATVVSLEYDPNRTANIALISFETGHKEYRLCPRSLKCGQKIYFGNRSPRIVGSTRLLHYLPLGCIIHNIELTKGGGGQLTRSAGTFSQLLAKDKNSVTVTLPSGEIRLIRRDCTATIGQVGNIEAKNLLIGKAGRKRWARRRPKVRGSAMNPNDHPHGGGEGRCPVGRSKPVSPWGKPALGVKTRRPGKKSDSYIIRRRQK